MCLDLPATMLAVSSQADELSSALGRKGAASFLEENDESLPLTSWRA